MKLQDRSIALTDVETTGLDPSFHEIIEIGLVVVQQRNLQIIDTLELKVKPEHPGRISPDAKAVNGYNENAWQKAISLEDAMRVYAHKTQWCAFAAHNVTFDWDFIKEAFRKTGIQNQMDFHRIDLWTLAWTILRKNVPLEKFSLDEICGYLEIAPEPRPHRALNGALKALEVLRKLDSEFEIRRIS